TRSLLPGTNAALKLRRSKRVKSSPSSCLPVGIHRSTKQRTIQHLLPLMTALGTLLIAVNSAVSQTWTQTSAPITNWTSSAWSADGSKLVVVARGGFPDNIGHIYRCTNSAATWTPTSAPNTNWWSVASSADGSKLVAGGGNFRGSIYVSTDSGVTW